MAFMAAACSLHILPAVMSSSRFIAVMHGDHDGIIPGNALVVDPKKQFRPLSKFGNAFLNRFQCSQTNSEVLKGTLSISYNISFVTHVSV